MSLLITKGLGPLPTRYAAFDSKNVSVRVRERPVSSVLVGPKLTSSMTVRQSFSVQAIRLVSFAVKINKRTMKTTLKSC